MVKAFGHFGLACLVGAVIGTAYVFMSAPKVTPRMAPKIDGNLIDDEAPPAAPCCNNKEQTCAKGHIVTLGAKDKLACPICSSTNLREYRP